MAVLPRLTLRSRVTVLANVLFSNEAAAELRAMVGGTAVRGVVDLEPTCTCWPLVGVPRFEVDGPGETVATVGVEGEARC